jgi:DNA polymerase-1
MSDKKLYLLDSNALAYRAYYAMIKNPLTTSSGQPVGAVYGFVLYLLKLIKDYKCPYIAAVFDSRKPSFRKDLYDQYKAHRQPMPDDLASQMPLIHRCVESLGIPLIIRDGLEADDVLATLTRKAEAEGFYVYIVTKDKDLMQLVGEKVKMLVPKDGGSLEEFGPQDVLNKMGVGPEGIRDLLSLMGDASDNVPGVDGVGPKTALKVLEKAGTVENLLANPDCVKNEKLAEKIKAGRESIILSKELVTLRENEDLGIDIESLVSKPLKREESLAFLKEMEFKSILNDPLFVEEAGELKVEFAIISDMPALENVVARINVAGLLSIDTETTHLEPHKACLVGISIAVDSGFAWYVPVGHDETDKNLDVAQVLGCLKPVLESVSVKKIGQNLKYDYQIFKKYGIILRGIKFDAMIAAYLADSGKRQLNLESLAFDYLSLKTISIEQLIGKGKDQKSFASVPVELAARYSAEDAVLPLMLMEKLVPVLDSKNLSSLFENIEIPLLTALAEMEWQGVTVDTAFLKNLSTEFSARLTDVSLEIFKLAGEEFNLNSPKQISEVLFEKMGLPKSRKTKTGLSTDVDALEKLAPDFPVARMLLVYREIQKLLSTYIDALPQQVNNVTGRVHTSFNQAVTATGRLSSTGPNLQNIPIRTEEGRRIRKAFVAPAGFVLVSADYSQIELRILAHMSKDPYLVGAFHNDKDIHTATAAVINGVFPEMVTPQMRMAAKTVNFGLLYGMGPHKLSRELGISFPEARNFIETYFRQFPTIRKYMDESVEKARAAGYSETLFGRRRYLPDINSESVQVREAAERTAVNTPVQGTAADIIKVAMVGILSDIDKLWPEAKMLLQVHDELVFEVREEISDAFSQWAGEKMSGACSLDVPLKVETGKGKDWGEAH